MKFADATGLELAQQREDIARRIDELHDKISAWEREKSVSAADLQARRADLAKLEAQRDELDAKSPPAQGSFFRYAVKEIRDSLGKDPAIDADMVSYYKAVNEHNRTAFADRLPVPAAADQASYVGVDVCSSCHPGARKVWNATPHAKGLRDALLAVQGVQPRVRELPRDRVRKAGRQHRDARGGSEGRAMRGLPRTGVEARGPTDRPEPHARRARGVELPAMPPSAPRGAVRRGREDEGHPGARAWPAHEACEIRAAASPPWDARQGALRPLR